jgi:hypothetical protein
MIDDGWIIISGIAILILAVFLFWKYREYQLEKIQQKQTIANEVLKFASVVAKTIGSTETTTGTTQIEHDIQEYINGTEHEQQPTPPEEDIEKLRREFRERRGETNISAKAGEGIVTTVHDFQHAVDEIGGNPAYLDFSIQRQPQSHLDPSIMMRKGLLIPMN